MAHERGLVALETTVVTVTTDFAVCQSTARWQDGRVFTDIGGRESDQRERAFGTPLCQNGGDQGFRPRTQAGLKY